MIDKRFDIGNTSWNVWFNNGNRHGFGISMWSPKWYLHVARWSYPRCPEGIHGRLYNRDTRCVVIDKRIL